jgi:hypothetical protein
MSREILAREESELVCKVGTLIIVSPVDNDQVDVLLFPLAPYNPEQHKYYCQLLASSFRGDFFPEKAFLPCMRLEENGHDLNLNFPHNPTDQELRMFCCGVSRYYQNLSPMREDLVFQEWLKRILDYQELLPKEKERLATVALSAIVN